MSRRWLPSADVEISARGALATSLAGAILAQGELPVGNGTVPLVAVSMPCSRVWIGTPTLSHAKAALNDSRILVGSSRDGNNAGGIPLEPDNHEGFWYPVEDASKVYLSGFADGDAVEYQIQS